MTTGEQKRNRGERSLEGESMKPKVGPLGRLAALASLKSVGLRERRGEEAGSRGQEREWGTTVGGHHERWRNPAGWVACRRRECFLDTHASPTRPRRRVPLTFSRELLPRPALGIFTSTALLNLCHTPAKLEDVVSAAGGWKESARM